MYKITKQAKNGKVFILYFGEYRVLSYCNQRVLKMLNSFNVTRQRNKYKVKRLPDQAENILGMSVVVIILL